MIYDILVVKRISNEHYKIIAMKRDSYEGDDLLIGFKIPKIKEVISDGFMNSDVDSDLFDGISNLLSNPDVSLEEVNAGFAYAGYEIIFVSRPDLTDVTLGEFTSIAYLMKADGSAYGMITSNESDANTADMYVNFYKTYSTLPNQVDNVVNCNRDLEEYAILKSSDSSPMYDYSKLKYMFEAKKERLVICHNV